MNKKQREKMSRFVIYFIVLIFIIGIVGLGIVGTR